MPPSDSTILTLDAGDVPRIVDVLAESFRDYPVLRFVLADAGEDYSRRGRLLTHFFVMARVLRNETLLGIGEGSNLAGVALVSRPHGPESPPELGELRERVWAELGPGARERYEAFGAACARFQVHVLHLHLNMIGIRPQAQGRGLGRRLLDRVHRLSLEDPESEGMTLTTEDPANLSLYEHAGYRQVGHQVVEPGLETWGFYRED